MSIKYTLRKIPCLQQYMDMVQSFLAAKNEMGINYCPQTSSLILSRVEGQRHI